MSWALAARLARREVRRRPGRTLLVMLLVATPVFGMTLGAVVVRTDDDEFAEEYARRWGAADLVVSAGSGSAWTSDNPTVVGPDPADVVRSVASRAIAGQLRPRDRRFASTWVTVNDDPIGDALLAGRYEIRSGRAPERGEVAVSTALLDRLELEVGDRLQLDAPVLDAPIVASVRVEDAFDQPVIVAPGFPFERAMPDQVNRTHWYQLAEHVDAEAEAERIATGGTWAASKLFDFDRWESPYAPTATLAWGFVAGSIALAIVGIIVCAAFATSARRQLVTLGQLSASGAEAPTLRRMLALQGTVSGVLGSVVGVGGALAVLYEFRTLFERVVGHDPGPYVVRGTDLAVIACTGVLAATIAAAVPARSIVRVPVLAALGGRRPLGRLPRRLAPIGLALGAAGLGMLVLVALAGRQGAGEGNAPHALAAAAVIGGLLILAGVCCSSPIAVSLLSPIAARGGGTVRLAARSISRLRARSAAVVTAIAVAGIAAMSAGTAVAMNPPNVDPYALPRNVVVVGAYLVCDLECGEFVHDPEPRGGYVTDEHLRRVAEVVPGIEFEAIRSGAFDPRPFDQQFREFVEVESAVIHDAPTIADAWLVDYLDLSADDRSALERDGVLGFAASDPESTTYVFATETRDVVVDATSSPNLDARRFGINVLMTAEFARSVEFELIEDRFLGVAPADLTGAQRRQLESLCCEYDESWAWDTSIALPGPSTEPQMMLDFRWDAWEPSRTAVDFAILAVTMLLVGLVIAIGLSLSAVESRDERDTLTVLGARPRSLRRLAGIKAAVLVLAGGLLAVPAGFLPTWLVFGLSRNSGDDGAVLTLFDQVTFPWTTALGLVVILPILVGVAAWASSAIGQWFRPVRVSTMAFD